MSTNSAASSKTSAAIPEAGVLEAMHRLMFQFKARMQRAWGAEPHSMTPMEARTLEFFGRHSGSTQRDLVEHARRDKAQIARLVGQLLERGLLQSEPDDNDRRSLRLSLTDSGRAARRALQVQRRRFENDLLAGFSADDRQRLLDLLARMHANVASDDGPPVAGAARRGSRA